MKKHRCPYCSRKISYSSAYMSRRKAEYICRKCGKESKVVVDKKIYISFILAAAIAVIIMILWTLFSLSYNILGVFLVALPLIIFFIFSTNYLRFEPLKKYKKSMEAKKAGIAYSDNLITEEIEDNSFGQSFDSASDFKIDSDIFNSIKNERNAEKILNESNNEVNSNSDEIGKTKMFNAKSEDMIAINSSVRENHSESDAPLKKLHSEPHYSPRSRRHYIQTPIDEYSEQNEQKDKPDGNKYSANRRF